jgi:glycosyltransferase involved in cell wall biosynthesis
VILTFAYPSAPDRTGGVIVLYELANACARRDHEVHFVHGPLTPYRVGSLDELPPFPFDERVAHHLVDRLDDPRIPTGDVVFGGTAPRRLGLPVDLVQGFRMLGDDIERDLFRTPLPKVCVASWLVDVGVGYGSPPEQLWYLPLGLDHRTFGIRTAQDTRLYDVAMLSHPHREKGFAVGMEALHELKRRLPDLRAVVFGIDPPSLPLAGWVRFWQAPDHTTLANQIYNESCLFLQPSYHEGFGYTAVEAMACGCALVTTDNGGSRDYAVDGETALVVPPGGPRALADAAERLLQDVTERTRLAAAGAELVRRRFDWDRTAALLESRLEAYTADPVRYQRPPVDVLPCDGPGGPSASSIRTSSPTGPTYRSSAARSTGDALP